jgi:hypothetical protein
VNRLTITHTHTEGTAAEGTSKGDAAGPILKANGFVFRYGAWRIRGSRDRMASWRVEAAAEALRAAGFEVEVRTDDTPRPTVVVEAERAERAAARADRFAGYAANAQARSVAAGARADQLAAGIPLGQPVLVGHHSQRRHERHLERIQRHDATCVEEGKKARYWDGRADSAENSQRHRENIPTTLRRIEQLEAALRAAERRRAGPDGPARGTDTAGPPDHQTHRRDRALEVADRCRREGRSEGLEPGRLRQGRLGQGHRWQVAPGAPRQQEDLDRATAVRRAVGHPVAALRQGR